MYDTKGQPIVTIVVLFLIDSFSFPQDSKQSHGMEATGLHPRPRLTLFQATTKKDPTPCETDAVV